MFLLKIGIFKVNISSIFSLAFGIAIGIAIITLIYLLYVLKTLNSKKFKKENTIMIDGVMIETHPIKSTNNIIENNSDNGIMVKDMIKEYQSIFLDKRLRGDYTNVGYCKELSLSLLNNIAKLYYPKSNTPMLEISVEDTMTLLRYIVSRVDNLLNYDGLKFIRRIRLKTIYKTVMFKKTVENWKIYKLSKKYNFNQILNGFKFIINFVNPFYWVRKAIIDTSFSIITKHLCLVIIGIVGEEGYKIYSNSVFKKENEEIMISEGSELDEIQRKKS